MPNQKSDTGRGEAGMVLAVLIFLIAAGRASAYTAPQATVDPQYQNFNSINLNNVSLPSLDSVKNIPTSLPTGSFNFSQFFNLGNLLTGQSIGSVISLVLNIVVAVASVVSQIAKTLIGYLHQ